jgi:hypothetical protein
MHTTIKSLLESMRITDAEVTRRKELLTFTALDAEVLATFAPIIGANVISMVDEFYRMQTSIPEIALLIGDSDTLERLR